MEIVEAYENSDIELINELFKLFLKKEFVEACKNSNFELIKELFEKGVDIHYNNEQGFVYLCENGELEMAKWLYEHGNVDIHSKNIIHGNPEWALINACWFGRLEVAKWLVSIGADIKNWIVICNIICQTSKNDMISIINWLSSIDIKINEIIKTYHLYRSIKHDSIGTYYLIREFENKQIYKQRELFTHLVYEKDKELIEKLYDKYLLEVFKQSTIVEFFKIYLKEKENYEYFCIFFLHSQINDSLLEVNLITIIKEFLFY